LSNTFSGESILLSQNTENQNSLVHDSKTHVEYGLAAFTLTDEMASHTTAQKKQQTSVYNSKDVHLVNPTFFPFLFEVGG
jgi:hypothetical protein